MCITMENCQPPRVYNISDDIDHETRMVHSKSVWTERLPKTQSMVSMVGLFLGGNLRVEREHYVGILYFY